MMAISYAIWLFSSSYVWLSVFAVVLGLNYGSRIAAVPAVLIELFGLDNLLSGRSSPLRVLLPCSARCSPGSRSISAAAITLVSCSRSRRAFSALPQSPHSSLNLSGRSEAIGRDDVLVTAEWRRISGKPG
jgi:hypothetical protein